mmetsp:Transcript_28393/g.47732  ORF Transcript_28393/g.47732 Transcript_28393/m.47732 type:complete len:84 (+) Transcript_28393:188-439(+)
MCNDGGDRSHRNLVPNLNLETSHEISHEIVIISPSSSSSDTTGGNRLRAEPVALENFSYRSANNHHVVTSSAFTKTSPEEYMV